MEAYIYTILAILGVLIGSFLNVVILRFDTGASISRGRSKCFSCEKALKWYELLPIVSFTVQKGRCRACLSKISWQYPLVELLGAVAFPLAYKLSPGAFFDPLGTILFVLTAALLCLYIVICVYDMRHKIIPDLFSYSAAGVALAAVALEYFVVGGIDPLRLIAGPALFLFFFFFWAVSRGTWMGLGDAKLALSIGLFLGLSQGITAVLMSFWIGAGLSLLVMLIQRITSRKGGLRMKSEVPFGPYMLIGFLIAFIWHIDMAAVISFLAV
ncbi:MAG TPA: prepilin peptidase [Candidatus Paceibacterota bacterium]